MSNGQHAAVEDVLTALDHVVDRLRGNSSELVDLVERSPLPMHLTDNERRFVAVNRACCLLFRLPLDEILARRPDDLTQANDDEFVEKTWSGILEGAIATGEYTFCFRDGSSVAVVFHARANVVPGRHLTVLIPVTWCQDELGPLEAALAEEPPGDPLSPRESEVMRLVADGADIEELSSALRLSPHTVKVHLRNIYRKLGARNRAHAVAIAFRHDLI